MFFRKEYSKGIISLAVPVVLATLSQTLINLLDTAFIGRLPDEEAVSGLAAVGLGIIFMWVIGGFFNAIGVGTQAVVSRREGEGRVEECGRTAFTSLLYSMISGMVVGVCGWFLTPLIFPLLSSDPRVVNDGIPFVRWRFIGLLPMLTMMSLKGFFDAIGVTRIYMNATVLMNIYNAIAGYALILGKLGIPRLGVKGAGIAATTASYLGAIYMISVTFKEKYRKYRIWSEGNFAFSTLRSVLKVSLPAGTSASVTTLGFLTFVWITGRIGTVEQAITNVLIQLSSFTFMPCIGLGVAAATFIGQSLGKGEKEVAKKYGIEAVKTGILLMGIIGLLGAVFPGEILSVFTSNKEIVLKGKMVFRILALSQVLVAVDLVLSYSLLGAGDSRFVMSVEILLHWLFFIPLAYILALKTGLKLIGAWLAVSAFLLIISVVIFLRFLSMRWARIKL